MPSVDVVIPCYNYAKYLPRCIDSVLSQQGVEVRALIIDDCSTDDTPAVGAALAQRDSRVLYRRHAKNMRHIATYNEGLIDWAQADYVLLLSADDLLAPLGLQRATRVMEENPNVHMTYGMALLFTEDAQVTDLPADASAATHAIVRGADFLRRSIVGNPVPTPSAIARTRIQHKVGGYSAALPHTADMAMWMRFAVQGDIGVVPQVLAYKRTHATNMSIAYAAQPLGDFRERVDACDELLGNDAGAGAPTRIEAREIIGNQVFWWASSLFDAGETAGCDEALKLAAELAPSLRSSPAWRRLKLKRVLPAPVRRAIVSLSDRARGTASPAAALSPTRQIGWWPENTAGAK
ncbi:MAG: glycosyltransferase family 2 protein [Pseudomonadota bacterium]